MAGLLRQRGFAMVTFATSVMVIIIMMLRIVSGRSLSVDCPSQSMVNRQTWKHPCRGSSQLSIAASDEETEAAATPVPVETITQQLRLLKQDSATVERKAMRLRNRYVTGSSRIDGLTAAVLEVRYPKSPEFHDLQPLTLVEVNCFRTSVASSDNEADDNAHRGTKFQQRLNDVVIRSVEVLSFSSVLLQRAIIQEDCNEPIPLSDSMVRLQHDVTTMLCRLQLIVYPRSIDSLPSNDTLQGLQRIGHTYQPLAEGSSPIPRHWIDYLVLRDIVNATRELKRLYANLIDHNC